LTDALQGRFGRVADLGGWLAGVQASVPPHPFRRVRLVLVASPDARDRTLEAPVDELVAAGLAAAAGVSRRVVDVVSGDPGGRAGDVPELTGDEFEAAYELGRFVADEEADAGTDLLIVGVDGGTRESDLTASAALVAALLGREPIAMVGTDTATGSATGLDDRGWMRRVAATRDALRRVRRRTGAAGDGPSTAETLRLLGGPRIAVLAGLLRQSAGRRTPVMLDGTVVCAAALAAGRLDPGARRWWQAAVSSPEPAAAAALDDLRLVPLLDLGVRAGDGTGGLLALPLLEGAVDLLGALVIDPGGR
jgi:nicotinate-nucleotide--dimethylbenzimidazole phosphoribosyltransferase